MSSSRPPIWYPNNPMFQSYSKVMAKITADDLYEGLVGYGLFSDIIPPLFTSVGLFNYFKSRQIQSLKCLGWNYIFYESARNNGEYRPLGIPNPFGYEDLCRFLADKWPLLQQHFKQYTFKNYHKISRLHIRKINGTKSLFKMSYSSWQVDENPAPDLKIGARYVALADISNCFPSIYTHALSWALTDKAQAKQNVKIQGWWPNILDKKVHRLKNGETHGLLIGPHSSNVLSEIILVVIDQNLSDNNYKFIRNIDDYQCYVESYEEAERFHNQLREELRKFDLALNLKKCKILELPLESADLWVNQLSNASYLNQKDKWNYHEVRVYLDLAVDLLKKNNDNASILYYAMKVIASKILTESASLYVQKVFFHLSVIYPYLIQHLSIYVFDPLKVPPRVICAWVNYQLPRQLEQKNYEAVSFMIYFAIKYKFKIDNFKVHSAIDQPDCIFKVIAFIYFKNNKNRYAQGKLKKHAIELSMTKDDLESNWLFVYEALDAKMLQDDWQTLKQAGVTFIR